MTTAALPPEDRAADPEVQLVVLAARCIDGRWPHVGTITEAAVFAAAQVFHHRHPHD